MMDEEDEDDMYAPDEGPVPSHDIRTSKGNATTLQPKGDGRGNDEEGEEEGEELEEDESDSDIDIIVERKGDQNADSAQPARINALKAQPGKIPPIDSGVVRKDSSAIKNEAPGRESQSRPGSSFPAIKTSTIDIDAKPIYEATGKQITDIDMDADFPEDDKPWRRPGTDMTDYFNYGFDEFTWASYCLKQKDLRKEVTDSKKQMEEMQNFLTMPGGMPPLPGMPAPSAGAQPAMPAMGGAGDFPPEMQQMMAQMMGQGMDVTSMDPAAFMQMMQAGAGGAPDPSQSFGGQGYGQQGQNQQQMGYGYGGGGRNQSRGQGRRW